MKKTLLMTAALLAICAGLASAAGLNLGWDNCAGLGAGALNKNFACNTNTGIPSTMIGSFVAPAGMDNVNGYQVVVDLQTAGATLSPWWDIGGCRASNAASFSSDFTTGPFGCTDYWLGAAGGGGFYIPLEGGPNRAEIRIAFAIASGFGPIAEGDEAYLFKVTINNSKTAGLGACARCTDDVCIVFTHALITNDPGLGGTDATLTNPAFRAHVTFQGGETTPCPDVTPAKRTSWGTIKSLYR
ncbi:MAG TPA: hypothetical protein VGK89_04300 [Candidatus Eisenbacteria bacterium]|jgi:hypothetical protein